MIMVCAAQERDALGAEMHADWRSLQRKQENSLMLLLPALHLFVCMSTRCHLAH